ncbi:hypothetical protein B0F90DRAFT_353341 [Multifurca ochricompacta]|uniref:Secreted protein n=1 Tax=Multifurca ochricompacta TaxID=376703 RepID=A0AAD4M4P3_9AGAM|nr:hypothetical protein B0F90DRAFT_353341 [Multifurca ochricompacta]
MLPSNSQLKFCSFAFFWFCFSHTSVACVFQHNAMREIQFKLKKRTKKKKTHLCGALRSLSHHPSIRELRRWQWRLLNQQVSFLFDLAAGSLALEKIGGTHVSATVYGRKHAGNHEA